uniref:39S ribosomal protein L37, mitochondrial n=1 Tax=Ascaris lumbricoides TaxID=6252 RepID=A0A0M3HSS6_ASCLU
MSFNVSWPLRKIVYRTLPSGNFPIVSIQNDSIPMWVSKRTNVDEAGDPAIEEKLAGQLDAKQTRPAWYQQSRAIFLSHLYQKQGSKKSFIFKTRDTKCKKSSKKETLTQEKLLHTTDITCTNFVKSALFMPPGNANSAIPRNSTRAIMSKGRRLTYASTFASLHYTSTAFDREIRKANAVIPSEWVPVELQRL